MFPRVEACCADFDEGPVPMTPLKRLAAGAAVAALMAGATACTKDDPAAAPTSTPAMTSATPTASLVVTSSPTVTPTPKPTLSQRAQAEADAIAMVKKYYAVADGLANKPPAVPAATRGLKTVASGTELAVSISSIYALRSKGRHTRGVASYDQIRQVGIDVTSASGNRASVKVRLCLDVSPIKVIDSDGAILEFPNRQPRYISNLEVVNSHWPARDAWRVDHIVDESTKC